MRRVASHAEVYDESMKKETNIFLVNEPKLKSSNQN